MCTAVVTNIGDGYFGRNLDFESDFGEKIIIVPRKYRIVFSDGRISENHPAIIGMGIVSDGYPLFFDGINECGVGVAGLRFAGNAEYRKNDSGKENITSYELILRILSECKSVRDAEKMLENANITDKAFSEKIRPAPLHWIIADRSRAITLEQTREGLLIFENPVGVLTNNPPFSYQMENLRSYMMLSPKEPENNFSKKLDLSPYSRGMGAMGLPGDMSSASRFVRTSFVAENSRYGKSETDIVNHFFHTLYQVFQQKGCVQISDGFEITNYSSCCNLKKGIYYYTTYNNSNINGVNMHRENLDSEGLLEFDLIKKAEFNIQN